MIRPLSLRIVWIAPDDLGGGVVSVAQACCRQASLAGHEATLLLALEPRGTHANEFGGFRLATLASQPPHTDIPIRLSEWLRANPQDVVIFNSCEQADIAIPFVPQEVRVISAIHDSADRYVDPAIRYEESVDGIIAVSEVVAREIRPALRHASKLHVVLNGTVFPEQTAPAASDERPDDLLFVGGDKPMKGAFDCITLWTELQNRGFRGTLHWFGEMEKSFQRRIERLPERERIVLYGRRTRREIFEVAAKAKVFLMLSRIESFGMATVEAMGMGCLPVAWDIPTGTKEVVSEHTGYFAPLGEFDVLADTVIRATAEHATRYRSAMGAARGNFNEGAMWARFDASIRAIIAAPAAIRPLAGARPPHYRQPTRVLQRLPRWLRSALRTLAGRWPKLGFALRGLRGR